MLFKEDGPLDLLDSKEDGDEIRNKSRMIRKMKGQRGVGRIQGLILEIQHTQGQATRGRKR